MPGFVLLKLCYIPVNWGSDLNDEQCLGHCIFHFSWNSVSALPFKKSFNCPARRQQELKNRGVQRPPPPALEPQLPLALCSVDCTKQFCTLETRQNDIFFQSMDFLWHGRRIRIVQDRAKYCFLAYLYKYVTISFLMVLCRKKNVFIFSLKYTFRLFFLFHDQTSE